MGHFIVERFVPGATGDTVRSWAEALEASIDRLGVGDEVSYLGSELLSRDETCLSFFDALNEELVRKVNDHSGTPYERVLVGEAVRQSMEGDSR